MKRLKMEHIEGIDFYFDPVMRLLRERSRSENEIRFADMNDHGTHYTMDFHRGYRNFPQGEMGDDQIVKVEIRRMVDIDPEGMAEVYNFPFLVQKYCDVDVINYQSRISKRLNGELPLFNIAGRDFIVYLGLGELRDKSNPSLCLKISELYAGPEKNACYYDPVGKQVIKIDTATTTVPPQLVKLLLPERTQLDPIGAARLYGLGEQDMLGRYPVGSLAAIVIPWKQTDLLVRLKANKKRLEKQKHPMKRKRRKMKR